MRTRPLGHRWLFVMVPRADRAQIRADMLELHADRRRRSGIVTAQIWFWWHTARLAAALWRETMRQGGLMKGLWLDLQHVACGLRASRTFTAVAVVSLALGIGANAAVFSVIRTLLLDDLSARAPHELSFVYWHHPGEMRVSNFGSSSTTDPVTGLSLRSNYSYPTYSALRDHAPEGVEVAGFTFLRDLVVALDDRPATLAGGLGADAGYFTVLEPAMALGRGILPADDREDASPVAVLSHAMFMRVFGGDRGIVGRAIRVNHVTLQIVGVTGPEFRGLSKGGFFPQTEITVPLHVVQRLQPSWVPEGSLYASDRHFWLRTLARFPFAQFPDDAARNGVASRWAATLGAQLAPLVAEDAGPPSVALLPGRRGLDQTSPDTRRLLWSLMGLAGVVLLIACVNLSGLMLARGAARQREMSVRRALGAGRWRLMRGLLVEGLVLAVVGSAAGLLLTFWGRHSLTSLLTAGLGTAPMARQPLEVSVDGLLVAATIAVAVLVAVVFSLLPAIRLTRREGTEDLRQQVIGTRTPRLTLGRVLVALQVGITVPLLVCAALFLRTVENLGGVDPGFNPEGLTYFKVNAGAVEKELPGQTSLYLQLLDRLHAMPGVTSVTLAENALLSGVISNTAVMVGGERRTLYINAIGPGFMDAFGIQLLAGRMPGVQDGPGAPLVGVVNQTAARRFFGDESALGRVLNNIEIVGIVSDALYEGQRADVRPTLFPSALQRPGFGGHQVVVRSTLPLVQLEPGLRRAVAEVHPDLPVPEITTQLAHMRERTMRERVFAQLLTLFGAFALLLACIGLHGVTSYSVARRTNEIGVRMALGATPHQVLWMVIRHVAVLAFAGLAVGVPVALWVAPLFGSLLFGVTPTHPGVLAVGSAVMLVIAIGAGWFPARRAARLDPLAALRTE